MKYSQWKKTYHVAVYPDAPFPIFKDESNGNKKGFWGGGRGESPGGLFHTSLMILSGMHFFLGLQFLRTTVTATKQKENKTDQTHHRIRTRLPEASPDFVCVGGEWLPGTS